MSDAGLVLVALTIAVGIVGVVIPVLPGALLAWAAIAVWALAVGSATAWAVLAIATLSIGLAQVVKILVPGRRLRDAGGWASTNRPGDPPTKRCARSASRSPSSWRRRWWPRARGWRRC